MGFLFSRRWIILLVVVVVLAALAYRLGEWQFGRLDQRERANDYISANLKASPVDIGAVMQTQRQPAVTDEWLPVRATGVYNAAETVLVRYQTRDGQPGVDLVTPLMLQDGSAVLVNRGWLGTPNTADVPEDLPEVVSGQVSVVGYLRPDATGRGTDVEQRSTRAISSVNIGDSLDFELRRGYLELRDQTPPAEENALLPVELPDLGEGPHFFYGLQWWFFGALALFGFGYFVFDERRRLRRKPAA